MVEQGGLSGYFRVTSEMAVSRRFASAETRKQAHARGNRRANHMGGGGGGNRAAPCQVANSQIAHDGVVSALAICTMHAARRTVIIRRFCS